MWLLNSQLTLINGGSGATTFTQVVASISPTTNLTNTNLTVTRANASTAQSTYSSQHNVLIVSLTAASTTYYLVTNVTFTTTVTLTYQTSYLTATRIA